MAKKKNRLIDANDYKDVLYAKRNNPSIRNGIQSAIRMLEKQPTVDAVEVAHGRWEVIEASDELFRCSVCGEWQFIPEEHFAYCPYCGAKMDGDGNG